jgi:hypothetical protein
MRFFTLIMNKKCICALNIMRQMAMDLLISSHKGPPHTQYERQVTIAI